jgi:Ser/Thr protein kinase RdoA (MazF antagonist)
MSVNKQSEQDLRSRMKPVPDPKVVGPFLATHWGLHITKTKQIDSYDDANFYCEVEMERKIDNDEAVTPYLVKFYNAYDTSNPDLMHGLPHMLEAIHKGVKYGVEVPSIINPATEEPGGTAHDFVFFEDCTVVDGSKQRVAVRVFNWIAGTTLNRSAPTLKQMVQLGRAIADVTKALQGFDHPAFHRTHLWDLAQMDMSVPLLHYVDNDQVQEAIRAVHRAFHDTVLPLSEQLPKAIIMADCNDANVIVSSERSDCEVTGLIDFSDAVHTWRVNELAIAMAYALLTSYGRENQYLALGGLFAGYTSLHQLTDAELDCLSTLIQVRLSISVMVGACAISKEPENEYLKLHAVPGRAAILFLSATDPAAHRRYFKLLQVHPQQFTALMTAPSSRCAAWSLCTSRTGWYGVCLVRPMLVKLYTVLCAGQSRGEPGAGWTNPGVDRAGLDGRNVVLRRDCHVL